MSTFWGLVVLVPMIVNLFLICDNGSSNRLKKERAKLVNVCLILLLEALIIALNIIAGKSWFLNVLIFVLQCEILISTIFTIKKLNKQKQEGEKLQNMPEYKQDEESNVCV